MTVARFSQVKTLNLAEGSPNVEVSQVKTAVLAQGTPNLEVSQIKVMVLVPRVDSRRRAAVVVML